MSTIDIKKRNRVGADEREEKGGKKWQKQRKWTCECVNRYAYNLKANITGKSRHEDTWYELWLCRYILVPCNFFLYHSTGNPVKWRVLQDRCTGNTTQCSCYFPLKVLCSAVGVITSDFLPSIETRLLTVTSHIKALKRTKKTVGSSLSVLLSGIIN